jgi:hypothetical protein
MLCYYWYRLCNAWAKGRRLGLIGPGAPSPQKPTQLGKEKRRVLVGIGLDFGVQVHMCTIHVVLFMWHYSFYSKPLHIYK